MTNESIYWLFSSAAQSISALIAFLLAGVAIAYGMMDRSEEQDASLYDVVKVLRRTIHRKMSWLVVVTGIGILSSLLAIYLNPTPGRLRGVTITIAALSDIFSIIGAIYLVILIVSPSRYVMAAKKAVEKEEAKLPKETSSPANAFFHQFIKLEQDIRESLLRWDLGSSDINNTRYISSFRQMVNTLYQNERISLNLRIKLLKLNEQRNLLFHGHIDQVSPNYMRRMREALNLWDEEKAKKAQSSD